MQQVFLNEMNIVCALGNGHAAVWDNACDGSKVGMALSSDFLVESPFIVGQITSDLLVLPEALSIFDCRNNQLAATILKPLVPKVEQLKERYGCRRIGVVMGTSTSGVSAGESALLNYVQGRGFPADYQYDRQEIAGLAKFVSRYLNVDGPSLAVSTACSSSALALSTAHRWLSMNVVDAVVVGGVDTLCQMTVQGFYALGAMSLTHTNPFSVRRDGINIGEGGAVFIMSREPSEIELLGVGVSSDAHHISSPRPDGRGAQEAMRGALKLGGIQPADVNYLNLHGTGTVKNDEMESTAVDSVFGADLACSSSKPLTGHTLGAAGAIEAALCWLTLKNRASKRGIPHVYDGDYDPACMPIGLFNGQFKKEVRCCLSSSFAFGGSNGAVLMGVHDE